MQLSEQAANILSNHQKQLDDIKQNMQYGDWVEVCKKTKLTKPNAISAFHRIGSKHHNTIVTTVKEVIMARLNTLKSL